MKPSNNVAVIVPLNSLNAPLNYLNVNTSISDNFTYLNGYSTNLNVFTDPVMSVHIEKSPQFYNDKSHCENVTALTHQ